MNKTIDLAKVTGNRMTGKITVRAATWSTRYSWGHKAEVMDSDYHTLAEAKVRYFNRTWESYRYQSVVHAALLRYVRSVTGIDPLKDVCGRDASPMKSAAAERRRMARVAAREFATTLFKRLCAYVDGWLALDDADTGVASRVA